MKVIRPVSFVLALFLFAASSPAQAEKEIELGNSREDVIAILGKPKGIMKSGDSEYLSYPRGMIRITDGRVTLVKLNSPEEAQRKEAERQAIEVERQLKQRAAEQARETRIKEGNDLKQRKLNDRSFQKLPDEEKLSFWKDFQTKYPEVSVNEEIAALQKDAVAEPETTDEKQTAESKEDKTPEKSERTQLLETINEKQEELDALIQKAKTTSAGRTFRSQYLRKRKSLEDELVDLRAKLKTLPAE